MYFKFGIDRARMAKIVGKFRRESETNYEAYLDAIGVGYIKRKLALKFTPEMEIKYDKEQDKWLAILPPFSIETKRLKHALNRTFITSTPVRDVVINFKLDQPFPESSIDGREVRET